jgi:negative regulator of flagellin synthesis FlgM
MIDPTSPGRIGPVQTRVPQSTGLSARVEGSTSRAASVAPSSEPFSESLSAPLSTLPRSIVAEGPPIDAARVANLKAEIAADRYAVDPDRVAAAMLASEQRT